MKRAIGVSVGCIFFVEVVLFVFLPRYSFSSLVVRHVSFGRYLEQGKSFYTGDIYDELANDEMILFGHAFPDDARAQMRPQDVGDPFMRMMNRAYTVARPRKVGRTIINEREIPSYFRQWGTQLNNTFYRFDARTQVYLDDAYDDIFLMALYCDFDYRPIDTKVAMIAGDDRGGYIDTHQLIALVLQKRNGCFVSQNAIDKKIAKVVARIVRAQENDEAFSDLFAERIVVLYWAGAGDLVRYSWIRKIVSAQNADGGWGYRAGDPSDAHATGLASVALRYYIERDIYQDIFVQDRKQ